MIGQRLSVEKEARGADRGEASRGASALAIDDPRQGRGVDERALSGSRGA
jgi:hypothetical protein